MSKDLSAMTKEELVALLESRRSYNREAQRKYRRKPGNKEKAVDYSRERARKIKAGYDLAKKAGLI